MFLILAIISGLWPACIASRKGHPFLLWWIFSALMWIVAMPYAMLVNRGDEVKVDAFNNEVSKDDT